MRRFFRPPLLDLSHSSSVKFARIGNLLRSYRPRFLPETKLKATPASSHHVVAVRNRHTIGRGQPIQPMEHGDGIGPGQHVKFRFTPSVVAAPQQGPKIRDLCLPSHFGW